MDYLSLLKGWDRPLSWHDSSYRSGPQQCKSFDKDRPIPEDRVLLVYWKRKTALFLLSFSFCLTLTIFFFNLMHHTAILYISLGFSLIILAAIIYNIVFYKELLCVLDEKGLSCAGSPNFVLPWKDIEFVVPVYRRPAFMTYSEGGEEIRQRLWRERKAMLINTIDPKAVLSDYFNILAVQKSIRNRRKIRSMIMPVEYESDFEFPSMFDYIESLRWSWFVSRDRLMITEQDATFVIFERPHRLGFCFLPMDEMLAFIAERGVHVTSYDYEP